MALPNHLGGLGLDDPQTESKFEYSASCNLCHPISGLILQQSRQLNSDTVEKQRQARSEVRQEKRHAAAEDSMLLLEELPNDIKRMINLAAEKVASNWLSVLPVAEHGFYLHKTAFRDAICLRFGWMILDLQEMRNLQLCFDISCNPNMTDYLGRLNGNNSCLSFVQKKDVNRSNIKEGTQKVVRPKLHQPHCFQQPCI